MTQLKIGDVVNCKIKEYLIVSPSDSYDEIKSFAIVATDQYGCYLFVPHYIYLKNTLIADKLKCRTLGLEKRYLNENIVYILDTMVAALVRASDEMRCQICHEFFPFATANQDNGVFICYNCKRSPFH